ncbi:LPS-assembly protein LptD [Hwanghaeella sp.]|uniref:LPS-assembly protein LptD n=1 Tax=Hwanghaeella sp. TaxID=2605943 RepID=UPI003CCBE671
MLLLFCSAIVMSTTGGSTALAQQLGTGPVLFTANELTHDRELGIVTARGNVEIMQGERVLLADTVSFNQKTETVTANGNIKLLEPTGEVIFADYVELTNEMKDGVIKEIRLLLTDNARVVANGARRTGGNTTELAKAIYSPCSVCADDPDRSPLWQIKAERVIHDQKARKIEYRNASLEMWGIPVAYTPYFEHPDPTVKRETGFLFPEFGANSNVGSFFRAPFFWAIADDKDATIDPVFTSDEGIVYSGEYRQRFINGEFNISGSAAVADREVGSPFFIENRKDQFRGHVFSDARFDIDDQWRAGFDVERSTDQTYLRRFNFFGPSSTTLESNAFIEGFNRRNYMAANGYLFQDTRLGQRPDSPVVFPLLEYKGLGDIDDFGGRWSLDSNFRYLYQEDKSENQRLSVDIGYEIPITSPIGFVTTIETNLRMDAYNTNHFIATDEAGRRTEDGFDGRIRPELKIDWRYPFVRHDSSGQTVVEPIVALLVSPDGGNSPGISNDDSVVVELDETNLLDQNRTPGLDRVEGGTRLAYGLRAARYFETGGSLSAFVGQSHKFTTDNVLEAETGLENGTSDIVGRVDLRPSRYVDLFYRFRIDEDNGEVNRSEVGTSIGSSALSFGANYTFLREGTVDDVAQLDELLLSMNAQWDDNWRVSLFTRQDLINDIEPLEHSAVLTYEDECFRFDASLRRTYTSSTDLDEIDEFVVRLTFKTVGGVETELF